MILNHHHHPVLARPAPPGTAAHPGGWLRPSIGFLAPAKRWINKTLVISLLVSCGLFLFAGCQSNSEPMVEPMVARFYLEARAGEAASAAELPISKVRISVSPKPVLTEYDVANVDIVKIDLGWCLLFNFNQAATRDLYKLTSNARGRRLMLTLNNVAVGAHVIDQAVADGALPLFVELPDGDLPSIADRVRRTSSGLQAKGK